MKPRLIAVLVAVTAFIGAALLLLLPITITFGSVEPVGCGSVFAPDTKVAQLTDEIQGLGDRGLKAECDSAAAGRVGWGIGLGGAGVLVLIGALVVRRRVQESGISSAPPTAMP